jgi:hypothetical protein
VTDVDAGARKWTRATLATDLTRVTAYRGTAPYRDTEVDQALFWGRNQEITDLTSAVVSSPLVLFFGRSGLGKTSLINAGLLPRLRKQGYLPVVIRLGFPSGIAFDQYVIGQVIDACRNDYRNIEIVQRVHPLQIKEERLWTYLERSSFLTKEHSRARDLTPVLIFDQFEEIFSPALVPVKQDFIASIGDIIRNRVPDALQEQAEKQLEALEQGPRQTTGRSNDGQLAQLRRISFGQGELNCRVLLSLREDYLADLDEVKGNIPTIFRTMHRLLPRAPDQARLAITEPPQQLEQFGGSQFQFGSGVVDGIITFLLARRGNHGEADQAAVEPTHLNIVCDELDRRRRRAGKGSIELQDLGGSRGLEKILDGHYKSVVSKFPNIRLGWNGRRFRPGSSNWLLINFPRKAVRQLCEWGPPGKANAL